MTKNDLKLSTMVGENFKIYLFQMGKKDVIIIHHGSRKF